MLGAAAKRPKSQLPTDVKPAKKKIVSSSSTKHKRVEEVRGDAPPQSHPKKMRAQSASNGGFLIPKRDKSSRPPPTSAFPAPAPAPPPDRMHQQPPPPKRGWALTAAEMESAAKSAAAEAAAAGKPEEPPQPQQFDQDSRIPARARQPLRQMNECERREAYADALEQLDTALKLLTETPCEQWLEAELILRRARYLSKVGDSSSAARDYADAIRRVTRLSGTTAKPMVCSIDHGVSSLQLEFAYDLYENGGYDQCLGLVADIESDRLAPVHDVSGARRLRALVNMRTTPASTLESSVMKKGDRGARSSRNITFPDDSQLPHRYDSGRSDKNLAKESKKVADVMA